jgi:hypothetical protein
MTINLSSRHAERDAFSPTTTSVQGSASGFARVALANIPREVALAHTPFGE